MIHRVDFFPFPGLSSPHLQTIVTHFTPSGKPPSSVPVLIKLFDEDLLSCHISEPENVKDTTPTIVMVHGLGGSHESGYLIRLTNKFLVAGYRIVRVNLRGCGSGKGLANRPYNGGTSQDIFAVMKYLKEHYPHSRKALIGFSLGGNIVIKLAGELGPSARHFFSKVIAVCPTLDLFDTVKKLEKGFNRVYHQFYMRHLLKQAKYWLKGGSVNSIYEYDEKVTAPFWDYKSAHDYYEKCSSINFVPRIEVPCNILFSEDDPIIDFGMLYDAHLPENVNVYISSHGGHLGFLGWNEHHKDYFWMDYLLFKWLQNK